MEKRAVIQPGLTPPEQPTQGTKQASDLEQHTTRRLTDRIQQQRPPRQPQTDEQLPR